MSRRTGYSLLEVLLGVALMVLVLGVGLTTNQSSSAGSHSLALEMAGALRDAAGAARAGGHPVAISIPGGSGFSRSYYRLEGETQPRVVEVRDFSSEYPRAYLFAGFWTPTTSSPTVDQPVAFDFDAWGAPRPQDPTLVFLPDGTVTSNGLPIFAGAYHLLVSQGGRAGGTAPPPGDPGVASPPVLLAPQQLGAPFTVTLGTRGQVEVSSGVVEGGAGISIQRAALEQPTTPSPPGLSPPPTALPVVLAPQLTPDAARSQLSSSAGKGWFVGVQTAHHPGPMVTVRSLFLQTEQSKDASSRPRATTCNDGAGSKSATTLNCPLIWGSPDMTS